MKTKRLALSGVTVLLSSLCLFCSCMQTDFALKLGDVGEDISFHTAVQAEYLAQSDYTKMTAEGKEELSRPQPLHLDWSVTTGEASSVTEYVLQVARDGDFGKAWTYYTTETSFDVYNLCIGSDYSWRVTAKLENGKKSVSPVSTFTTAAVAPRNIYVDGITNVRDLGGWERADGSLVRQGMIYRCGRLNKSEQSTVEIEITQAGIDVMLDELGICSEIDLRSPTAHNTETGGITSSPLGEYVTYFNAPLEWNVGNLLTDNKQAVRDVFTFLADEDNYPVIYHCNIGTDRTGLFAYLINGLMGVAEEDLYRDYLFSNFGKINNSRTLSGIQNSYVKTIKGYPGATLSEKIENCLLDIGVQSDEIDSLKAIMTE